MLSSVSFLKNQALAVIYCIKINLEITCQFWQFHRNIKINLEITCQFWQFHRNITCTNLIINLCVLDLSYKLTSKDIPYRVTKGVKFSTDQSATSLPNQNPSTCWNWCLLFNILLFVNNKNILMNKIIYPIYYMRFCIWLDGQRWKKGHLTWPHRRCLVQKKIQFQSRLNMCTPWPISQC